ncbi:protein PHOTOSYSTEM I ASSEMBLY 2, chloroplastic [Cynara cardunculus var. scolymus]|uniref:Heat shock protein DnaJ, cysteine-rich domain-containing protein n=1 Tax=Cynara cardunculus var. scolymus TaxID=59895 RepID=A0A118JYI6_CYNCS|nr:protein PHOTOSYSTEM I ASSEMBLY 2, chloroplastic [Cynara cardunculus var. scolymus]KVH98679.1 Heat shock protein DnaJ, cysteine-rich domain-containing protein [Cynara cardunculus var. scolymus]
MGSHGLFFHCSQIYPQPKFNPASINLQRGSSITSHASKSNGFPLNSIFKKCETCGGQGAIDCGGCKGTGKNKKNGNIFERWKCYDCQGFGLRSCPSCGKGGLTPEQRGER